MAAPIHIVADNEIGDWRRDAYRLEAFEIDGHVLRLTVSYTGGCEPHRFEVLARKVALRRARLEAELSLAHDAGGDSCKAIIREQLQFSLEPLLCPAPGQRGRPETLSIRLDGQRLAAAVPPLTQDAPQASD